MHKNNVNISVENGSSCFHSRHETAFYKGKSANSLKRDITSATFRVFPLNTGIPSRPESLLPLCGLCQFAERWLARLEPAKKIKSVSMFHSKHPTSHNHESGKWVPSNSNYLSSAAIFHFHESNSLTRQNGSKIWSSLSNLRFRKVRTSQQKGKENTENT